MHDRPVVHAERRARRRPDRRPLRLARSPGSASDTDDNGYAHPVENVRTLVDLDTLTVVKVEDDGVVPIPQKSGNYSTAAITDPDNIPYFPDGPRTDVKPFDIVQHEGPSFTVKDNHLEWQKWDLRIGFTPREGLVLHQINYAGRSIIYRASLSEMFVPYGDPEPDPLPQAGPRRGGVRHRPAHQLPGTRLRLPRRDRLPGRRRQRQRRPPASDEERHLPARRGPRHRLEAHRLPHRPRRGPPHAPDGDQQHRHRRQLRVRLLLVPLPGRLHRVRGQALRRHLQRRDRGGGQARVRHDRRPRRLRPAPSALLQRPTGHGGRRHRQPRLRGHPDGDARGPGQPRRQRLAGRGDRSSRTRR